MAIGQGNRQTLAADGPTTAKQFIGPVRLVLSGTFGGGTAVLRTVDPSNTPIPEVNGSFTAITSTRFDFPDESINVIDVDLSGATPTFELVVWIQGNQIGQ